MKSKFFTPLIFTLISMGPIGWFFIDLSTGRYDRLSFLFIVSIVATIIATLMWGSILAKKIFSNLAEDDD